MADKDREKMLANLAKARSMNPKHLDFAASGRKRRNPPGTNPRGRPRRVVPPPTEEQIEADIVKTVDEERKYVVQLSQLQIGDEEISVLIQQPLDYIQDLYRTTIDINKLIGKLKILRSQFKNALGGNSNMQMWLGKHLFGQKDGATASSIEPELKILTRKLEALDEGANKRRPILIEDARETTMDE